MGVKSEVTSDLKQGLATDLYILIPEFVDEDGDGVEGVVRAGPGVHVARHGDKRPLGNSPRSTVR